MRVLCRILAGLAILGGTALIFGGAHGDQNGTILFSVGLLSLTILTASEPHWPEDERRRRLGNKPYSDEEN
jgi:hypothetical protein